VDEVELVFIAANYLKELGYTIDKNNVYVKDNIVNFRNVKINKLDKDSRTNIVISDISVYVDQSLINITENTSSFLFNDMRDFNKDESSRLSEKNISIKYSFTKHNDKVIKSCTKKITNLYNGNVVEQINNDYMKTIVVDKDYKLTDGFPFNKKAKKLIKE